MPGHPTQDCIPTHSIEFIFRRNNVQYCLRGYCTDVMSQSKFVNPSRTALLGVRPVYYAIGNTPVQDLCADIPIRRPVNAKPLRVCLQGAGDIRNILRCVYSRRKMGDKQAIEFYVNDLNPAIVARDILLLTLASQMPERDKDENSLKQFVDLFISIYADLSLNEDARRKVDNLLDELLTSFPAVGGTMSIPAMEQLWHVKKTWALWKTNTTSMEDAQLNRNNQTSKDFAKKVGLRESDHESAHYLEVYLNRDLAANPAMRDELLHYYQTGNVLKCGEASNVVQTMRHKAASSPVSHCNWTLFDPETKQFLHYLSHPFQMLISASEAEDFQADNQTLLAALKSAYFRFLKTFSRDVTNSKLQIVFDVGDCNSFMLQQIPSDVTFDVIDTSNLADHLGLINMLLLASLKLNRDDAHATLWVEFLKAHHSYSNVAVFLNDCLGFPYSLLGTILKLQCFLPFESSLLFDEYHEYSGKKSKSNLTTGLVLKFKPIPCPKDITPIALQLVPRPSKCVFRQIINNYLNTLYDIYTGQIPKKQHSPRFFMSISTLLHLMCHAAQRMENPRQLFDHLYNQVRKCEATEDSAPTRHLDVFAFDVQVSSMCLCPTEYQPTEPLHPYFVGAHELKTLVCDVKHTSARDFHPCPIIGWIMADELTNEDQTILQGAAYDRQLLHTWAYKNAHRLQFIDIIHVPFPDRQVEIPFPFASESTTPNVTFLALSVEGQLLYEPVVTTLTQNQHINLANINSNLYKTLPKQSTTMAIPTSSRLHGSSGISILNVCEYDNCFKVKLNLRTCFVLSPKSKVALAVSCDDKNPLCATLKLNVPIRQKAKQLQTVLWVPASIENTGSCKVEVVDEHTVQARLKKDHHWLQPKQEKLNVKLLHKWPINRPLGVLASMFTAMEQQASSETGGFNYGHDSYLDARITLHAIYNKTIDQQAAKKGVVKLLQSVGDRFLLVSSLATGFLAYMPGLLITSAGTPVIELHYLVAPDPLTPEAERFIHIISKGNHGIPKQTIRCSQPEIELLFCLLEINSQFLSDETPKYVMMYGIHLKGSFLVPLYPKENPFGENKPRQSESPLMKELDRRRRLLWGENYRQEMQRDAFETVGNSGQTPCEMPARAQHNELAKQQETANSQSSNHCSYCLRTAANLERCGRCLNTLYCNKDCQRKHWKHHRKHCVSSK